MQPQDDGLGFTPHSSGDEDLGFTPNAAPASEKSIGGLLSNAAGDAGQMIGGAAQAVLHPIDTATNVATHLPEIAHGALHSWGLDSADDGHRMQTLKDQAYEHPVSHLLDVASFAIPAAKALGVGSKAVEGANLAGKAGEMADGLEHTANLYRAKDIGARTKQFAELDEDGAARLGQRMKDEGITGNARTMKAKAKALDAAEGQKVGDFRRQGDAMGAAPEHQAVMDAIKAQFGPKYSVGEHAGSGGEFNNALDSLGKLAPAQKPGIPTLSQVKPGAGPMNMTDDARLASQATEGTKEVRGVQQVSPSDGQMELLGGTMKPDLFPMESHSSALVPEVKKVPVAGQDAVPSLAGQQDMFPSDPFHTELVENPTTVTTGKPTTSDFAKKATDLNQFARTKGSLLQANDATTDVANAVSNQNDASLVHALGPDSGKAYLESLAKESDAKALYQMAKEKRARQLGKTTAPSSLSAQVWHGFTDRFGYSMTAKGLDQLANVVRKTPAALGKYGPALVNLGPAALATTVHLLLQRDPEFGATLEQNGIGQ
jgi:hypothetical protein